MTLSVDQKNKNILSRSEAGISSDNIQVRGVTVDGKVISVICMKPMTDEQFNQIQKDKFGARLG